MLAVARVILPAAIVASSACFTYVNFEEGGAAPGGAPAGGAGGCAVQAGGDAVCSYPLDSEEAVADGFADALIVDGDDIFTKGLDLAEVKARRFKLNDMTAVGELLSLGTARADAPFLVADNVGDRYLVAALGKQDCLQSGAETCIRRFEILESDFGMSGGIKFQGSVEQIDALAKTDLAVYFAVAPADGGAQVRRAPADCVLGAANKTCTTQLVASVDTGPVTALSARYVSATDTTSLYFITEDCAYFHPDAEMPGMPSCKGGAWTGLAANDEVGFLGNSQGVDRFGDQGPVAVPGLEGFGAPIAVDGNVVYATGGSQVVAYDAANDMRLATLSLPPGSDVLALDASDSTWVVLLLSYGVDRKLHRWRKPEPL